MSFWHMAGIRAMCLGSESTRLTDSLLNCIRPYSQHLVVCYDNDKTGKACAEKINSEYGLPVLDISKFTNEKDISDFFKNGGDHEPIHKEIIRLLEVQETLI